MHKILLTSVTAIFAIMPAFADTVTTLPNNAVCNETNLGTSSGAADIEVAWEANTITTQWYTGYGENTAAANATTCTYDGTINLPQTNPSRPGYAFNGWKLRTPTNPLLSLDTSINGTNYYAINAQDECNVNGSGYHAVLSPEGYTTFCSNITDLSVKEWKTEFSYGTVYGHTSCQPNLPADIAYLQNNLDALINNEISPETFLSNYTAVAGAEKGAIAQQALQLYMQGNETAAATLLNTELLGPVEGADYSTNSTGRHCFCQITGYKANGSSIIQNISSNGWVYIRTMTDNGNNHDHEGFCSQSCTSTCAGTVWNQVEWGPGKRTALYNITE